MTYVPNSSNSDRKSAAESVKPTLQRLVMA